MYIYLGLDNIQVNICVDAILVNIMGVDGIQVSLPGCRSCKSEHTWVWLV